MPNHNQLCRDYARIEQAIQYLEKSFHRQPPLAEIAAGVNLSEFHFQRLFSNWVGISPKRFLQYLTKEYAKKLIEDSDSILNAAYDAGLSGPSRLHDLFVSCEAVTPGQYKQKGAGLTITHGIHPTLFGECLLAKTKRGICYLSFLKDRSPAELITDLAHQWPKAELIERPESVAPYIEKIFSFTQNAQPAPLHLFVKGTNFQIKVWEALIKIPLGRAVTYEDIARHIGMPKAARAVGNAVGSNPIPFLIPCHRVIRKMGQFGNYGGGTARKKAMLGWEAALVAAPA